MKAMFRSALILAPCLLALSGMAKADTELSFYGLVDVWAGSKEAPANSDSTARLDAGGMTTSFLGTRIQTTLPNGVRAFAVAEMFFRPDTGEDRRYPNDEFFARAAYVGARGDLGQLKAGRTTAPLFVPVITSNPFGASFNFSPAVLHSFLGGNNGPMAGNSAWSNSISYTTPSMGGLRANVVYAFGEQEGDSGANRLGGSLTYRQGGLMVTLAGHSIKDGAINAGGDPGALGADSQDAWLLGLSYDLGPVQVFGMYQALETGTATGDIDTDTAQAGVAVPVGQGKAMASYAHTDYSGARDTERNTWAVGYSYPFNTSLDMYAAFLRDDLKDTGDGNTYGIGARFRF